MIVGIVLGVIGVLIAIFALKCLRMGNMEDRVKATMTITSGAMFIVAGEKYLLPVFNISFFQPLCSHKLLMHAAFSSLQGSVPLLEFPSLQILL